MTTKHEAKYRDRLPQLDGRTFLTDGGVETCLIFHEGWDLPMFASFPLLDSERGRKTLRAYFDHYVPLAVERGLGFILESVTWRASPDWGRKLGYDPERLAALNRASIDLLHEVRAKYETPRSPMPISGAIGPRGDGYDPGAVMSVEEAQAYHAWQVGVLRDTAADLVSAFTMTNSNEAIGIARAAQEAGMPCAISFTVETDGHLPTGETLAAAIERTDAETDASPAYYMINCAHPSHFDDALDSDAAWVKRLRGLRANASRMSHAELDNAQELDAGNPQELGEDYAELLRRLPQMNVLGGCCGTDHRHIAAIGKACCGNGRKAA